MKARLVAEATGSPPPPEGGALDGFGIVTLASLFPVALVLALGLMINATVTAGEIHSMQIAAGAVEDPSMANCTTTARATLLLGGGTDRLTSAEELGGVNATRSGCAGIDGDGITKSDGWLEGFFALLTVSPYAELYMAIRVTHIIHVALTPCPPSVPTSISPVARLFP